MFNKDDIGVIAENKEKYITLDAKTAEVQRLSISCRSAGF